MDRTWKWSNLSELSYFSIALFAHWESGVTLSRDFLLKEALEKHALCPSLNNLNNYLSLLRKVLREFDLSDSIVTIPKLGIVFNVESIVSYPTADGGEEETLNQGGEKHVEEESDEEKSPFL